MKLSIVVALFVLLQLGWCGSNVSHSGSDELSINTSVPTPVLTARQLTPDQKVVIYWRLLDQIYHRGPNKLSPESLKYKTLVFRIGTIAPHGIETLKERAAPSASLLEDFERKNLVENKEFYEYPGTTPIYGQAGERDLEAFFERAKKRDQDVIAVVGLSEIGLDAEGDKTLVYFEFYKQDGQLERYYVFMTLERLGKEINGDRFSDVESFEFVRVSY